MHTYGQFCGFTGISGIPGQLFSQNSTFTCSRISFAKSLKFVIATSDGIQTLILLTTSNTYALYARRSDTTWLGSYPLATRLPSFSNN